MDMAGSSSGEENENGKLVVCLHPELTDLAKLLVKSDMVLGETDLGPRRSNGAFTYPGHMRLGSERCKNPKYDRVDHTVDPEKIPQEEKRKRVYLAYEEDKKFFGAWPRPEQLGFPTDYFRQPSGFEEAFSVAREIGNALGFTAPENAEKAIRTARNEIQSVKQNVAPYDRVAVYVEVALLDHSASNLSVNDRDRLFNNVSVPGCYPMIAEFDVIINEAVELAGGRSVIQHREDLVRNDHTVGPPFDYNKRNPDVIVMTHNRIGPPSRQGWEKIAAVKQKRVYRLKHPITWTGRLRFLRSLSMLLHPEAYGDEALTAIKENRVPDKEHVCKYCGHAVPIEAKFCPDDGSRIPI